MANHAPEWSPDDALWWLCIVAKKHGAPGHLVDHAEVIINRRNALADANRRRKATAETRHAKLRRLVQVAIQAGHDPGPAVRIVAAQIFYLVMEVVDRACLQLGSR